MIKAIIFDMDGVLADTEMYHLEAYNKVMSKFGLGFEKNAFKDLFGRGSNEIFRQKFYEAGIKEDPIKFAILKDEQYRQLVSKKVKPMSGVLDLIDRFSHKFKMCVASSSSDENVRLILSSLGIIEKMEFYLSANDVKETKPSPEIYKKAIDKLSIKPSECVVIEDAELGIISAKGAGAYVIGITNTLEPERLQRADMVIENLEELSHDRVLNFDLKDIQVKKRLNCTVSLPASKSLTNRALVIAALAGKCVIKNPLNCDDTYHMVDSLKKLGIKIERFESRWIIHGGKDMKPGNLYIGNSGTCARFLTALAAIIEGVTLIDGDCHMRDRPIIDLVNCLNSLGLEIESNGFLPIKITGGKLIGGECKINCSNSSQYLSALLMIGPYIKHGLEIDVKGGLVSKPFVDLTLDLMRRFGVNVLNQDYKKFTVKPQNYNASEYTVEGDMTTASYFFAAAAITGGRVKVLGINPNTKQGDIAFLSILEKMGVNFFKSDSSITVIGGKLKGITVDMNDMPDVVQTLAVVALFAEGRTRINNIANLRIKETDRLQAVLNELKKLGAEVEAGRDYLEINPGQLNPGVVETYDDHRMAMAFSLVGLRIPGVKIKNPTCVRKTFPKYWEAFEGLK